MGVSFFNPTIDSYLSSNPNQDENYGSTEVVVVGTIFALGSSIHNRGVFLFDFSTLPDGSTVTAANVLFKIETNALVGLNEFTLYRMTRANWLEDQVTWNKYLTANNWTSPGGDYSLTEANSNNYELGDSIIGLDCLDAILAQQAAGSSLLPFLLKGPEISGSSNYVALHTSEDVTALNRPLLTVTYEMIVGGRFRVDIVPTYKPRFINIVPSFQSPSVDIQ